MPRAMKGVLVQCDESIKTIILKIDAERNDYIIEDLDDETLVVKADKLNDLKWRLKEFLRDAVKEPEESGSE
ncbi:uncharacterized protein K452DRAFT_302150 [Aplosporella prunicola CBS 121167]|uniref:General transcription and DNA repair factor IIH subunit TFB5 n=1 Tax=Aplosporella prunicola CBS 121167 TaxID=1176127 RepID=A0A6A6B029_9PEZI|nr:uncharacterized protein K452DRAFT_302150 [Aplosporella prunicola CBS 121167]KAF2137236.1 hypothetical protein K452DRAFT_302150 [Aplosporella prunicola CBS 121167]